MNDTESRLARFNRKKQSDSDVKRNDQVILEQAKHISQNPHINLRSIIEGLVQTSHEKAHLLGSEFMEKFSENRIADILVNNFISNLKDDDSDRNPELLFDHQRVTINPSDTDYVAAKQELTRFIDEYSGDSGITLSSQIENLRTLFPDINFYQLFDSELKEKLRLQIERAAAVIVREKMRGIFEGNGKEKVSEKKQEKKRKRFILDFLFRRVLNVDGHGKLYVNDESMKDLVEFLESCDYDLEKLYMTVYEEFRKMGKIQEVNQETRSRIDSVMGGEGEQGNLNSKLSGRQRDILSERYYNFMGEDFDFNNFFKRHIYPHILEIRKRNLPPEKHLRLVDITKVNPKAMAENIVPRGAAKPIAKKVQEVEESEESFIRQCRNYFNYLNVDGALTDEEMLKLLSGQLDKAKELIEGITADGLKIRNPKDQIHKDCQFIPEIINCRDLKKLIAWLANPELFLEDFPDYEDAYGDKKRIIAHQVRKMLEILLFYRRFIFDEKFKLAEEKRTGLEKHFTEILNIQNPKEVEIAFRVLIPLDEKGQMKMSMNQDGDMEPEYEITYDEKYLKDNPWEKTPVEIDGKKYEALPVERKKFMEVEVDIPDGKDKNTVHTKLLIYTGSQRPKDLIHCKGWKSYLSSLLRGKDPTDIIRWSIVAQTQEGRDAFRHFIYENYSSGGTRKITDQVEQRHMNSKGERARSTGSQVFDKQREFISATYATLPEKKGDEVEHTHVEFETQLNGLDSMLIYNLSDYTMSSHSMVYTPEREFENIFKYFFPPVIYGQKFANYKMQGFNYRMPGNDNGTPPPDEEKDETGTSADADEAA